MLYYKTGSQTNRYLPTFQDGCIAEWRILYEWKAKTGMQQTWQIFVDFPFSCLPNRVLVPLKIDLVAFFLSFNINLETR